MSAAMTDWARIPELLFETLSYFESAPFALFACAHVNRLWAEVSTTLLWKHTESLRIFRHVGESLDRNRFYARKVKTIGFWRWSGRPSFDPLIPPSSIHPGLSAMDFSQVWGVITRGHPLEDDLFSFLNLPLRTLSAYGSISSVRLLRHLQTNCTSLTHLRLGGSLPTYTSSELLEVVLHLALIHLDWPSELAWTSDDFIRLGASSTLRSFTYDGQQRTFHLSRSLDTGVLPNPLFPNLRRLRWAGIFEAGLLHIFSSIPQLGDVNLVVKFKPGPYFLRYFSGSGVRDLQISVDQGPMIDHDDLVAVAETCPLLESFSLENRGFGEPDGVSSGEDPEAIIEFARHAVNLHSLEIVIDHAVIGMDIFEAFDLAPRSQYKRLTMPTRLKTSSIHRHRNDQSPFSPCLEWLTVSGIEMDLYIRPGRLIKYLARAAPLLKGFFLVGDIDRLSRRVQKKWDDSHPLNDELWVWDRRRKDFFHDSF